jgi:hypothetical protein
VTKIHASEQNGRFAIQIAAETPDTPQAARLRRVLDGVVAMAEIGSPDLLAGGFQFDIKTDGKPGVSATVSMPVEGWLSILKREAAKRQLQKKAADEKKDP